jgi:hypothetical protein
LTAELLWKINKSILGGLKFSMEITANRPFDRIPELILCMCSDGQHLLSANDPKGRRIVSIPEIKINKAQREFMDTYDLNSDLTYKQIKGSKLFLFETNPISNEIFTLRWDKGFSGKV